MSIVDAFQNIATHLGDAYDALEDKGADIPQQRNFRNLASSIQSVRGGGGSSLYFSNKNLNRYKNLGINEEDIANFDSDFNVGSRIIDNSSRQAIISEIYDPSHIFIYRINDGEAISGYTFNTDLTAEEIVNKVSEKIPPVPITVPIIELSNSDYNLLYASEDGSAFTISCNNAEIFNSSSGWNLSVLDNSSFEFNKFIKVESLLEEDDWCNGYILGQYNLKSYITSDLEETINTDPSVNPETIIDYTVVGDQSIYFLNESNGLYAYFFENETVMASPEIEGLENYSIKFGDYLPSKNDTLFSGNNGFIGTIDGDSISPIETPFNESNISASLIKNNSAFYATDDGKIAKYFAEEPDVSLVAFSGTETIDGIYFNISGFPNDSDVINYFASLGIDAANAATEGEIMVPILTSSSGGMLAAMAYPADSEEAPPGLTLMYMDDGEGIWAPIFFETPFPMYGANESGWVINSPVEMEPGEYTLTMDETGFLNLPITLDSVESSVNGIILGKMGVASSGSGNALIPIGSDPVTSITFNIQNYPNVSDVVNYLDSLGINAAAAEASETGMVYGVLAADANYALVAGYFPTEGEGMDGMKGAMIQLASIGEGAEEFMSVIFSEYSLVDTFGIDYTGWIFDSYITGTEVEGYLHGLDDNGTLNFPSGITMIQDPDSMGEEYKQMFTDITEIANTGAFFGTINENYDPTAATANLWVFSELVDTSNTSINQKNINSLSDLNESCILATTNDASYAKIDVTNMSIIESGNFAIDGDNNDYFAKLVGEDNLAVLKNYTTLYTLENYSGENSSLSSPLVSNVKNFKVLADNSILVTTTNASGEYILITNSSEILELQSIDGFDLIGPTIENENGEAYTILFSNNASSRKFISPAETNKEAGGLIQYTIKINTDEFPDEGSEHLVTSGAVYSAILNVLTTPV